MDGIQYERHMDIVKHRIWGKRVKLKRKRSRRNLHSSKVEDLLLEDANLKPFYTAITGV